MSRIFKSFLIITLFIFNSCSFANKSIITVPVNSNPPGANVIIGGQNIGQTPAFVKLKPNKNYQATITKEGYSSATIDMETWYSVRDGGGGDGARCILDAMGVLPMMIVLLFAPEKCGSFKKENYFANLTPNPGFVPNNMGNNQNYYNNNSRGNYYGGYYDSYNQNQSIQIPAQYQGEMYR